MKHLVQAGTGVCYYLLAVMTIVALSLGILKIIGAFATPRKLFGMLTSKPASTPIDEQVLANSSRGSAL